MSQEEKKDQDDTLRRFIDRLEEWPEDEPPTPAQLRALKREIRLTQDDRDKLEILSENHIHRGRASVDAGAYDQAAAELARAAQLRPLDARPKTELAGIYLQRSLERGYGRTDRSKALKLARKALELSPGDPEAIAFLKEYRQMNADFLSVRYRRYILPGVLALAALIALAVWQRDWVFDFFSPAQEMDIPAGAVTERPLEEGESRTVEVNTPGNAEGNLETEILRSVVGRRNDSSFVDLRGRIRTSADTLGRLEFILRGRDADGNAVFAVPLRIRDENAPLLRPGDSQALTAFHWLNADETQIDHLDLEILDIEVLSEPPPLLPEAAEVVWRTPRPDGAALKAEVRDLRVLEAFDRQVMLMDLALTNTGVLELDELSVELSVDPDWPAVPYRTIGGEEAPLARGERRVWPVVLGLPLDASLGSRPLVVDISEVSR